MMWWLLGISMIPALLFFWLAKPHYPDDEDGA